MSTGYISGSADPAARSPQLVDEIANTIRRGVATGRYPVGARLRQEALAANFGVSRTPIREALRKLQAEGLIVFVPRRGALVRGPTPREIREAYRVRAELEGLAAELAAYWIVDEELRELARAEQRFHELAGEASRTAERDPRADFRGLTTRWIEANDRFHDVVQRAAQNEQLRQSILFLHRAIPRGLAGTALVANTRLLQQNAGEHTAIREAIADRDGARARHLIHDHIVGSGEIAASWFELNETRRHDFRPRGSRAESA
jgi:DNA-binding GntR family transcriptional regulator